MNYACGFLFDTRRKYTVLTLRTKPPVADLYNGIGGKLESEESTHECVVREFREETGIEILEWEEFLYLTGKDWTVQFFRAFSDRIWDIRTQKDEDEVILASLRDISGINTVPNLRWIIPMALDDEIRMSITAEKEK